jgi:hypothetical protein
MTVYAASFLTLALGLKIAALTSIIVGLLGQRPAVLRWSRPTTVALLVGLWGVVFASSLAGLSWAVPSFLVVAALWLLALVPPCKDWGVDPYTLIYAEA